LIAVLWLGERAASRRWIGIGLSVIGVIVVFAGSTTAQAKHAVWGNLLMFGTVLAWAAYTALAKRAANCDTLILTTGLIAVGALLLLPFAVWEYAANPAIVPSTSGLIAIAYLGLGASGVAYLFYNSALRHMDASQAGTFTNLVPVIGVLSGLLLGDSLSAWALGGGVLVAIGIWLTTFRSEVQI
jgi:drug/metabolite transporter (DMT)-like permease